MIRVIDPVKNAHMNCIAFYGGDRIEIDKERRYLIEPSAWKFRAACCTTDNDKIVNIKDELCWRKNCSTFVTPSAGDKIYISKSSKISRDALRNSGYTITLSPEKANYILIPDFNEAVTKKGDFIVYDKKENILDFFYIAYHNRSEYFKGLEKIIGDWLRKRYPPDDVEIWYNTLSDENALTETSVHFFPNCEEYKELLLNTEVQGVSYIWDVDIPMAGSVQINPETLLVWEKMEDMKMLEKQLVNSDWQKYPVTVLIALTTMHSYGLYGEFGPQGKTVLNSLKYTQGTWGRDRLSITPEDYDMFQKWAFSYFGCSENGGYVEERKFRMIPEYYRSLLKSRIAVLPFKIETPTTVNLVKGMKK